MKRKIISIDESKCTGCGQCIPDCPEGALQLIDGKARLVSDLFCDGLGACIGTCPEGAISVVEREAKPYSEKTVMQNIARAGKGTIKAHLEHLLRHGERALYNEAIEYLLENMIPIPDHDNTVVVLQDKKEKSPATAKKTGDTASCPPGPDLKQPFAGCPGAAARTIERVDAAGPRQPAGTTDSELRQWPVQLALLSPMSPFFANADLLVAADCTPFAFPAFHEELLAGKILIIFCPKLDPDLDMYIEKMAAIFRTHTIRSVTVARMEVPCCGGVRYVVEKAMAKAGVTIPLNEKVVTISGELRSS